MNELFSGTEKEFHDYWDLIMQIKSQIRFESISFIVIAADNHKKKIK
mgnify:CR=1 FL=1